MEGLAAQQEQQAKHRSKAGGGRAGFRGVPTNLEGGAGTWTPGGNEIQTPKWSSRLGVWVRGLGCSGFGVQVVLDRRPVGRYWRTTPQPRPHRIR